MRLWLCMSVAAVAAVAVTGASGGGAVAAASKPTLAVAVVGSGRVTSNPAGISCPGKCTATFAAGSKVLLTQKAKTGSRFLRWGGDCTGAGACRVKVSALAAVAAQFVGPGTQPPPTQSAVEPGGYSGSGAGGYNVTFYVPAGAKSLLNFTPGNAALSCAGGGGTGFAFKILTTTIKRDRSFTAKTSQSGVISGANATITSFVTGRFQGKSAAGAAAASGVFRADVVFTDTNRKCTSNDVPWTAARSLPPAKKSIEPGTYSGSGAGGYNVTFLVPAGAKSLLNFTPGNAALSCAGGGGTGFAFKILTTTIKQDRSFTAKTSQSGVISGANATITSFVTGYFQGPNATGATTASGVFRADVVFTDTNRKCTSNDVPWTAARTG